MVGKPPADTPDCPPEVLELIERFQRHHETYKQASYNETQVRREFIDPFFAALGWDIDNTAGLAEAYKDVIHEDAIKIGGTTKAPDYCFRIGQTRKFFVEAKKPSVGIASNPDAAYQLRRYGWTAKLSLSILTNFEEFAVYDCRIGPKKGDKASTARVFNYTFDEYADKWPEIRDIFAKDSILKGSFDKFAESNKRKRGTAQVDDEFLKEIESWRENLAKNIALRNEDLSVRELNYAVSKIVDRLIFLRMCEDRGIEPFAQLQALLNGEKVYARLLEIFYRADDRYNSGLFQFEKEKGRPQAPDELTPNLSIDDKVLKDIIKRIYYPCPYEFSVMPAEILGQVYEQFLGKVIRLTKGHRAKIEEKPEVRKAGGVYYTPTYIVEYIVKHTIGKLVEDAKTPKKVAELRILDPACGSGSFLLGAYQYLMDWHLDYYSSHDPAKLARKKNAPIYQHATPHSEFRNPQSAWRLTVGEKKRILLNNIYGVDIDAQAVEVTKLSLLLKVLEGESQQTIENQLKLFHERALPDLGDNIKCGNSLIGPDFYEGKQLDLLDEEERYRINAFDWHAEFPDIMNAGGFDAVIGNPPYVRQEGVSGSKEYLSRHFAAYHGLADLYVYFLERGVRLLREDGLLGYICSSKFIRAGYGGGIRGLLSEQSILQIVDYRDHQIFEGATTYPLIIILRRGSAPRDQYVAYGAASDESGNLPAVVLRNGYNVPHECLTPSQWTLVPTQVMSVLHKITDGSTPLSAVAGYAQMGIKTSLNEAFVVSKGTADSLIARDPRSAELIRPYGRGRDLSKWFTAGNGTFLVCSREAVKICDYPAVHAHLLSYEARLRARYEVGRGDYEWWVIRQVADTSVYDRPKIVYPDLCSRRSFAANTDGMYPNNTVFCINYVNDALLAFLNSQVSWFWIIHTCPANRGGAYRLFNQYMNRLPVRPSVLVSASLERLGQRMLDLDKQLATAKTPTAKTAIQRQIDATDRQIDQLVYKLYELTADEIKIVEEANQG